MAVKIDVISKGDVVIILHRDQACHRVGGEEQSMRIFPSLSRVIKEKVGSTRLLTTSRLRPYISAIGSQYAMPEPPRGVGADVDASLGDRLHVDHVSRSRK